jgi:hypothetical protein
MDPSEFINSLNQSNGRRELFRADPIGLVAQENMPIIDMLMVVSEAAKHLQNMSIQDHYACLRLLQYIAKYGPEITRRDKGQGY